MSSTAQQVELEDPTMAWGWIKGEHEITPILMGKNGKWVPAELHEGAYIGTDGQRHMDSGRVYALQYDECFRKLGECYPFGSLLGGEVSYYLKNGATIRLREAESHKGMSNEEVLSEPTSVPTPTPEPAPCIHSWNYMRTRHHFRQTTPDGWNVATMGMYPPFDVDQFYCTKCLEHRDMVNGIPYDEYVKEFGA